MRLLLVTLLFALAACDQSQDVAPVKVAAAPALEPSFVSLASAPHQHTIHFRIAAPRSRALYLDNCLGQITWALEHQQSGDWVTVWGPEILQCHAPPIEIAAGTVLEFHKAITAPPGKLLPGSSYRLVVDGLYFTHEPTHGTSDHSVNIQVPHAFRVSQPFIRAIPVAP